MRKKTKGEFSENTYINGESKKRIWKKGAKERGTTTKDGGDKKEKAEAKASQRPRTKGEETCQKYKMQQLKGVLSSFCFLLARPNSEVLLGLRSRDITRGLCFSDSSFPIFRLH